MWQRQNALINTENELSYCGICIFIDCLCSKSMYIFLLQLLSFPAVKSINF